MNFEAIVMELIAPVSSDAERITSLLASRFGTLSKLARAEIYELNSVINNASISAYIKIASEIAVRRVADEFRFGRKYSEAEIEDYLRAVFICEPVETVYLLSFDEKSRIIGCDKVCDGTINRLGIIPRKLLEIANRRGAKKVIIAHNHPGGIAEPSREDVSASVAVIDAFSSFGIELSKNYIVADGAIKSFFAP